MTADGGNRSMCVSEDDLAAALRAGTGSEQLAAARAHARTCETCRAALDAAAERLLLADVAEQGGHPDALTLSCYLDGAVSPEMRLLLERHVGSCPNCRSHIAGMRRAREEGAARPARRLAYTPVEAPGPAPRRVSPLVAWPAAAALAALLAWIVFPHGSHGPSAPSDVAQAPPHVTAPVQKPAPPPPVRNPVPPVHLPERPALKPRRAIHPNRPLRPALPPDRAPRPLAPSPGVPPAPKTMLASALPEDPAVVPEWARGDLQRLKETPPVFRGGEAPGRPAVALIEPDPGNAAIADPQTPFAWSPVPDVTGYDIRLSTDPEDPDKPAAQVEAVTVEEPHYRPAEPLEPGQRYVLTIAPRIPTAEASTEAPAAGTFRFGVLTPEQAREAAWAEDNAAKTPVTSAMVLYRLGLYAPARDLLSRWPTGKSTDAWAAAIRRAYDRRADDPAR